jgi:RNA polymerase sigma-70 factor (ECF subfamily)
MIDERLYEEWSPRLKRFCARFLGAEHDAEEVVQDVFTRLVEHRDRYDTSRKPGVLLFRLARNRCVDLKRRRRAEPLGETEPAAPERAPGPDLESAMAGLGEKEREVLLLTVQAGLTYQDVARILGCSIATVAARKYAAIRSLKRRLEP